MSLSAALNSRRSLLWLVCVFSVLLLAGCATSKPQVTLSESHNFAAINTFYLQPPLNSSNVAVENHLMMSISEIMQEKGLVPTGKDEADILVGFFPTTEIKEDSSSISIGLGTGVFGRSGGIRIGSIFSVPVGEQVTQYQNLQIDILQNGTFIYSAVGNAKLDAIDSISVQNALSDLVRKLLEAYPVKAAGVPE